MKVPLRIEGKEENYHFITGQEPSDWKADSDDTFEVKVYNKDYSVESKSTLLSQA